MRANVQPRRLLIGIVTVVLSTASASPAAAARLLTATIAVNGETMLESAYVDDGHADAAEVWSYVAQNPLWVEVAPAKTDRSLDESRIDYKGAITIRVNQADYTIVEAKTDHAAIVRDSESGDRWYVPVEELDRIAAENGLPQIHVVRQVRQDRRMRAAGAILAVLIGAAVIAGAGFLARKRRTEDL
jgi:LPXTG-motif cell wall-anchored protein